MKTSTLLRRVALLGFAFGLIASVSVRAEGAEKPIPAGVLKKFDKDGDGKLSAEEKAAWNAARDAEKKSMLEKYDANKDGKLDQAEKDAMKADKEKHKKQHQPE